MCKEIHVYIYSNVEKSHKSARVCLFQAGEDLLKFAERLIIG